MGGLGQDVRAADLSPPWADDDRIPELPGSGAAAAEAVAAARLAVRQVLGNAEHWLRRQGEFLPVVRWISEAGLVEDPLLGVAGFDRAGVQDVVRGLFALSPGVVVAMQGVRGQGRASRSVILIEVEHRAGLAVDLVAPFRLTRGLGWQLRGCRVRTDAVVASAAAAGRYLR